MADHIDRISDRHAVNISLLIARITLGGIFLVHGSQKLFGAFDGPGLAGIAQAMGPVGYAVAIGEFFGALGLLLGILSRFSAAAIVTIMIGAIALVHWEKGFFAGNGGFEYNISLICLGLIILIAGPGKYAVSTALLARCSYKNWHRCCE